MAYQFAHINDYSQCGSKKSLNPKTSAGCLGEAFRDEGMASHVKDQKKPEILLGSRNEINNAIENYREYFRDSIKHKLRKDGRELLAGVFSWPPGSTKEYFNKTLHVILYFLMKKYGKSLRCILSHEDEPFIDDKNKYHGDIHFHIHFYVVPEPHENFRDYHPGIYAKWLARKEGLNYFQQNMRYKWSMGNWQDDVYKNVSLHLGWEKERPKDLKEKRLSRTEEKIKISAKEESIKILDEARKNAEIILLNAEKIKDEAEIKSKQIENKMKELEEKNKILQEKEIKITYQENFIKGAEKAISEMKKKLPANDQLGISILNILNVENLRSNEKKEFYKIFFKEIPDFIKKIIKKAREVSDQRINNEKIEVINNRFYQETTIPVEGGVGASRRRPT